MKKQFVIVLHFNPSLKGQFITNIESEHSFETCETLTGAKRYNTFRAAEEDYRIVENYIAVMLNGKGTIIEL